MLMLNYDEDLDMNSVPLAGDFEVTVGTDTDNPSDIRINGRVVMLTLASAVTGGQVVTVDYTRQHEPDSGRSRYPAVNLEPGCYQ